MDDDDLQKAGRDLVATYKAAGLSMSEITAVLFFALAAVTRDPDTSTDTIPLLRSGAQR